jgi:HEAT repeat protein
LPALFSAVRRMPRGEANVVLPAVTHFGAAAEKWFIEGLRSKKSFMRQGCALGLGTLKTPLGVDALVRLLLEEPTEIWSEVARALGDAGAQAVMPLAAKLRDVDPELRERIVQALAHVAAQPPGVRGPIEMLANGRDALVGAAAQRALALVDEVTHADQSLRRGANSEQTVVRGFSRRFYEALSGPIELSPADLEEIHTGEHADPDALDVDDGDVLTTTDVAPLRLHDESTARRPRPLPRDR